LTPRFPAVAAKDVVRVAERLGFVFRRQRGSHAIYVRASDKARIVIPMHKGEMKRKTLRGIIYDLRVSLDEFKDLL